MNDRVIDISEAPLRIRLRNEQLLLQNKEGVLISSVPARDICAVIITNPGATVSQACISGLMESGAMVVWADRKGMPSGMTLPLNGNYVQGQRFLKQSEISLASKKRLWKQIVQSKISAQAKLLERAAGHDFGLKALIPKVRSGDPLNIEAQASSRYWKEVFGDKEFRRRRNAQDQNRYLNYGYAILRSCVARAICASGLHPCLGLHHKNKYNQFNLADDLMEPFRPIVDRIVLDVCDEFGTHSPIEKVMKGKLMGVVQKRFSLDGQTRSLSEILHCTTGSLVGVLEGRMKSLKLPKRIPEWVHEG